MKISGSLTPVPEKLLQENTVKNNPIAGRTAVPASVPSDHIQLGYKTPGLPADRLSASIITLAKFFSLPLDTAFLTLIRRQLDAASVRQAQGGLLSGKANAGGTSTASGPGAAFRMAAGVLAAAGENSTEVLVHHREALSMAALAARDKGLELSPQGLSEYASAIDGERPQGKNNQGQNKKNGRENGGNEGDAEAHSPEKALSSSMTSAFTLKAQCIKSPENTPLLDILNCLPGKNGQRWLVFPFSFTEGEKQYRVILRIMLDGGITEGSLIMRRMDLEIIENSINERSAADSTERRYLFIMDRITGQSGRQDLTGGSGCLLTLMLKPPQRRSSLKSLAKKLSQHMEMPIGNIRVINYGLSSFEVDNADNLLHSINKEV